MTAEYCRSFACGSEGRHWGIALTGAGYRNIPAHAPYSLGERLGADDCDGVQGGDAAVFVVFIVRGRGWFESRGTGRLPIDGGTAFLLLPNARHRCQPDLETGWTESWLEVRGPTVASLIKANVLSAADAVRKVMPSSGLEDALDALHSRARAARAGFDAEAASAALAVLAAWEKAGQIQPARSRLTRAIAEAERTLSEQLHHPPDVQALAQKLGVGYTHFRRAFKSQTGFAPWQYVLHHRLSRARQLLASSEITLEALAHQLGFSSAFHLSTAFKRAYGMAPEHWRRRLAREEPRESSVLSPEKISLVPQRTGDRV